MKTENYERGESSGFISGFYYIGCQTFGRGRENACRGNTCDLTRDDNNCPLHFTAARHADVIDSVNSFLCALPLLRDA
jgi:hypothetical protein